MKLADDILWVIFKLNASDVTVGMRRRLDTTRYASQVCRQWRQLALESSSLWGRLVLIDNLQRKEWIEQVLTRSAGSLIWVYVSICSGHSVEETNFLFSKFISVLQDHWERIEMLEVDIAGICVAPSSYNQMWSHMTGPAPHLRSFILHDPMREDMGKGSIPDNFFSSSAPMIYTFSTMFSITYRVGWLSRLETLRFMPQSLDNLSDILRWTPRLRKLQIDPDSSTFALTSLAECRKLRLMAPKLLLKLTHIQASMTIAAFNALWSIPSQSPADFYAQINISMNDIRADGMREDSFREQFNTAIYNVLHHHPGATSYLENVQWTLNIQLYVHTIQVISPSLGIRICLSFGASTSYIMSPVHTIVLESLQDYLKNVTSFSLTAQQYDFEDGILNLPVATLTSMTKVKVITANMKMIKFYNYVDLPQGLLFPELQCINLDDNVLGSVYIDHFLRFFERRVTLGPPSIFLRLTKKGVDVQRILGYLNHMPDAQVKWHLCDDGSTGQKIRCEPLA